MRKGFSIVELLVVALVVAILTTIGVINYRTAYRNTVENEGRSTIELITAAELAHRFETNSYITCTDLSDCNDKLNLELSPGDWDYAVADAGGGAATITGTYSKGHVNTCSRTLNADGTYTAITCTH